MINTCLVYIEKDGKYLMMHRVKKKNDLNHDKWIGIGGKFEDKESPEECAIRETMEETGLTLTDFSYRGVVTFVSNIYGTEYMHLFKATGFEGKIKDDCDEGNLEWIEKEKMRALPHLAGDDIFLDLLDTNCPFFSLKLQYEGDDLVLAILDGKKIV